MEGKHPDIPTLLTPIADAGEAQKEPGSIIQPITIEKANQQLEEFADIVENEEVPEVPAAAAQFDTCKSPSGAQRTGSA